MTTPDAQRVVDAIRVLRIELGIANDKVAAAAGLHPRDLDILDVIDRDGPCTPTHLASRTGVRAATLTGVLARLERAGWIARSRDERDSRSVRVAATSRFDELRSLYLSGDSQVKQLAESLPAADRARIESFLRDVANLVRASDVP